MTPIPELRRIVASFRGRFFFDAERGDLAYIAKACDDKQCDCERKANSDGDQDCSVSLGVLDEIDDVMEPIAQMLNALPAALDAVERLTRERDEAYEAGRKAGEHVGLPDHDAEPGRRRVSHRRVHDAAVRAAREDADRGDGPQREGDREEGQVPMTEPRFYIMKNGDYATHKPTPAKAVEAALVHCYFALDGDLVEVIDPAGEVAWSATVRTALDSYRAKVQR